MKDVLIVPKYVIETYSVLRQSGYEAFLVGGAVRDALTGKEPHDWDIATNATPEQVQEIFSQTFYENEFGTVGVVNKNLVEGSEVSLVVEVTTYRTQEEYEDFRRPILEKMNWGKTILEDLGRRDFTVNAIALAVDTANLELNQELVKVPQDSLMITDPYGGVEDLQMRLIRAVGDPLERFQEDALRMMRAVRFFAQLDFMIEVETLSAIRIKKSNLVHISAERVKEELWKILASERAYEGMEMLDEVGLLDYMLPELTAGKKLMQRGHHIHDVFTHSMLALKNCPSRDPLVRFAALLHDIGKVPTHLEREGINTFYNHDLVGAKLAKEIAYRFKLSKKEREKLYMLVRWHMFSVDTVQTDAAVRRFIRKVGVENIEDMIDIRIGDRLGSGTKDAEGWRLREFKKRIETLLMPTFTVKDLAINGHDVMRILQIPPSRKVGEILEVLFQEVLDDPSKNDSEYLSRRVRELL